MKILGVSPLLSITRGLNLLFIVFIATFALDSINSYRTMPDMIVDVGMNLIPAFLLISVFALSMWREWLGTVGYVLLALLYAAFNIQRLSWIAVIAFPLLILALLYFLCWSQRQKLEREFE